MEFLEANQICQWAAAHGLTCDDSSRVQLPELPVVCQGVYANGQRSGNEVVAAEAILQRLGAWDECLVRITFWGAWPSGEDWPAFYAWRALSDERRSLDVAPGHKFTHDETVLLTQLMTLIMENAWDAEVLCSRDGRADVVGAKISHDEWYEVLESAS